MKSINNHFLRLILSLFLVLMIMPVGFSQDKTGRPVRIVSLCFNNNRELSEILKIVDNEGAKGTDIIVLPETWRGQKKPELLEGETITALSKLAAKHHTYIISPIDRAEGKLRLNTAVLLDRNGKVVYTYDKIYPYWSEFDLKPPVDPGTEKDMTFDTDFGRIGIAICFDANFPEVWKALRDQGAEIVFWPSAYSAGTQLQAYALMHHYYILSCSYTGDFQVYDITGERIKDEKTNPITIGRITLDLDRSIYHENFNMGKLAKLLKEHGEEVEKEKTLPREQWFVLKAKKPGVSARKLAESYKMEELVDYQDRSRREITQKRGFEFGTK